MGLSKLISLSVTQAFLAVGTGNLPWVLKLVREAQSNSKASKWPKIKDFSSIEHKSE